MVLEIITFVVLGVLFGVVTGLIPGLHPNNLFVILFSLIPMMSFIPLPHILAFSVSLAISNTFVDFIPSILFGAPEEDSLLSILPGHRMLLEGMGYEALFLTVVGGMIVVILTVSTLPIMFYSIPFIYSSIKPVIHLILMLVVFWMVITEKGGKRIYSLLIFLLAGLFGFIVLSSLPSEQTLFPGLTGLFAISTLLTSIMMKTRIPEQKIKRDTEADWVRGGIAGWLAGLLAGLLPGIGSSQAGIIASQFLRAKHKEFMITLGGINTSNIFFTFVVFYLIGKTRSGAVWFISQIFGSLTINELYLVIISGMMSAFISVVITLKLGRFMVSRIKNVNYTRLTTSTIIMLVCLVFIFSGVVGLLVALTGTFMGLLAIKTKIKRSQLMGFLLFPTIMYYSGFGPYLLNFLFL
ncbi:MAG: tripartite tricarboxylate transporter permease [Candidatus Aenigmarchaeota archaeon]|nr:tripartite tricarboxylate transporter permease [Candidatus Aenigmarchaeota archaeon]